jgi:hypothetical protein
MANSPVEREHLLEPVAASLRGLAAPAIPYRAR